MAFRIENEGSERLPEAQAWILEIEDIVRRVDALPTQDTRSDGEILGYGEDGIPR